jgi:tRNA threonylcarbamoyladenosine biosynthesis protein TsaE
MSKDFTRELPDEAATLAAGRAFASQLSGGDTVYLHGDLGAGKTTFVRGVLQGLGHAGKVKSPTYTLVEPYEFDGFSVYHFDLYRFTSEEEWEAAGLNEYFNSQSICFVEWPEKAQNLLPEPDFDIKITPLTQGRSLQIHVRRQPTIYKK